MRNRNSVAFATERFFSELNRVARFRGIAYVRIMTFAACRLEGDLRFHCRFGTDLLLRRL